MKIKLVMYLLLRCIFLFSMLMHVMPIMAQIPSNPPETDSISQNHRPGSGFQLVNTDKATLSFSPYITIRYLNQQGLNDQYTDAFGRTSEIAKRNDVQFQKVTLYFKGWVFKPGFRYFVYVWTANANMGQGAQVVLAGNLQYQINKYLDLGAGVGALPTNRSLIGQWPFWLRQDARTMAEEFFRGSFTTGIWAQGELKKGLYYKTMLGNNLSQLGVDAGQMDNGFDTWSTALWWTTNDFGRLGAYGDFEHHTKVATTLGASFTRSNETRQSQPGSNAPENSQIRLSDGTGIFNVNAFNDSAQVLAAKYEMASINGGIKYKGFSLDAEYFLRSVSKFKYTGQLSVSDLFDQGYSIQASGMIIDKTLQLYSTGSYINGQYGKPWEVTCGLNWYVFKNKTFRVNPEILYVDRSPVGYLSYPTVVGATGVVFMTNLELFY